MSLRLLSMVDNSILNEWNRPMPSKSDKENTPDKNTCFWISSPSFTSSRTLFCVLHESQWLFWYYCLFNNQNELCHISVYFYCSNESTSLNPTSVPHWSIFQVQIFEICTHISCLEENHLISSEITSYQYFVITEHLPCTKLPVKLYINEIVLCCRKAEEFPPSDWLISSETLNFLESINFCENSIVGCTNQFYAGVVVMMLLW